MKTNIYFYLNDKEETRIVDITDDVNFYPLNVGDTFWFDTEMLFPKTLNKWEELYSKKFVNSMIDIQTEKEKLRDKYKIVSIHRSIKYNINSDINRNTLTIEYKVKKVKTIYWEFWQLRRWFNTTINKLKLWLK